MQANWDITDNLADGQYSLRATVVKVVSSFSVISYMDLITEVELQSRQGSVGANMVNALCDAELPHADKPVCKTCVSCLAGVVTTIHTRPNSCCYYWSDRIINTRTHGCFLVTHTHRGADSPPPSRSPLSGMRSA